MKNMKKKKIMLVFSVLLFQSNIVLCIPTILSTTQSFEYKWYLTRGGNDREAGSGVATDSLDNIYLVGFTYGEYGVG